MGFFIKQLITSNNGFGCLILGLGLDKKHEEAVKNFLKKSINKFY